MGFNYIYRYWHDGKVVYVGQTKHLDRRIKEHCREIRFYGLTEVDFCAFPISDQYSIDDTEMYYIKAYKPDMNRTVKGYDKTKVFYCNKWHKYSKPIIYENCYVADNTPKLYKDLYEDYYAMLSQEREANDKVRQNVFDWMTLCNKWQIIAEKREKQIIDLNKIIKQEQTKSLLKIFVERIKKA